MGAKAHDGDVRTLIDGHLSLARDLARYASTQVRGLVDHDDLVAVAQLGLVEAAHSFDAGRGIPFSAFATLRIRGAVLDELRRRDPLGRGERQRRASLLAARDEFAARFGRNPSLGELAKACGITVEEASRLSALSRPVPLDDAIARRLADEGGGPADASEASSRRAQVETALADLSPRLRHVAVAHLIEGRSLESVGEELGISKTRVRQLRDKVEEQLRSALSGAG